MFPVAGYLQLMTGHAVQLLMSDLPREADREWTLLLERAATGDALAFEQVMLRTERSVMAIARRMLGNVSDAEEAAQEVFLRVYKYLHRFDRTKAFEPWLYRLTVNVCNDLSSRRQRPGDVLSVADHEPVAEHQDPHGSLAADEQRRLVRNALAALPEKQRAAVVLRDLQGLSTAEVAEAMNISEATVRSHLSAARLRLKRFIGKRDRRPS
jgi:RNA polymerase sigma-70 factor (ECF subfamily)